MNVSDKIRDHVRLKYVESARLSQQRRFSVRCGTVEKELVKDVYRELGGAERAIREEREGYSR